MTLSWTVMQLADSAFPMGGFAHSGGLEAAVQTGRVTDAPALRAWVRDAVWQIGYGGLGFVTSIYAGTPLSHLDDRADLFLTNAVANRASRTQGRALLDSAATAFPRECVAVREQARQAAVRFHYAPVFGVVCNAVRITLDEAHRMLLSLGVRAGLSAAVRLGIAGTLETQRMLHELQPLLEQVVARCAGFTVDDVAQTAPLADLIGSLHERLNARMFQS